MGPGEEGRGEWERAAARVRNRPGSEPDLVNGIERSGC